jgi:hypothetical protein
MTHFLDEDGKISRKAPEEARELASFLFLVIDSYAQKYTDDPQEVRCFTKNCQGIINIGRSILNDEILWSCPECQVSGNISEWRGTTGENKGTPTIESPENEKKALEWFKRLTDDLVFSIPVIPCGFIEQDYPKAENWVITRLADYVEIFGLIVHVEDGKESYQFPITDLSITDEESNNFKLVEEFLDWWLYSNE